jgi:hypothetical protein
MDTVAAAMTTALPKTAILNMVLVTMVLPYLKMALVDQIAKGVPIHAWVVPLVNGNRAHSLRVWMRVLTLPKLLYLWLLRR